ncbi:dTMP kinase [Microbacterium sp.]|uniref:dTMP kinase n=1 Tax=Microbacterium sp. TaxID=51671 RepID=UPI003F72C272
MIILKSGSVIVLEGLDKAGKSTQIDRLRRQLAPASTLFAHMPSGVTRFSADVYEVLEDSARQPASGLAQQLAHLACHAENMPALVESADAGALVLDRWWWSTLAYGWHSGALGDSAFTQPQFEALVKTVWAPITASVVFVFRMPHEHDANNRDGVAAGYTELLSQHPDIGVAIPNLDPEAITEFILNELASRGLTSSNSQVTA